MKIRQLKYWKLISDMEPKADGPKIVSIKHNKRKWAMVAAAAIIFVADQLVFKDGVSFWKKMPLHLPRMRSRRILPRRYVHRQYLRFLPVI